MALGSRFLQVLDQLGHQAGPTGLVAGADPAPVVSMKILVEQDVILEVLALELGMRAQGWPPAVRLGFEDRDQPARQLVGDLAEIEEIRSIRSGTR